MFSSQRFRPYRPSLYRLSLLFCLLCLLATEAFSRPFFFDRRPVQQNVFSYYIYPIFGQIPGLQRFYGAGASVTGLISPETDITLIRLAGPAENFKSGDFGITIFTILDLPIFSKNLLFSAYYLDIDNGGLPETARGIDSDPNQRFILLAEDIKSSGGELSLSFYDEQLELYYGMVTASIKPFGFLDADKNFFANETVDIVRSASGYRYGLYWDDTDNRRDPRIGYRFQYERYGFPSTRRATPAYYQEDYNFTAYIPVVRDEHVLVLNKFYGSSTVTKEGVVDRTAFSCPAGAPPSCQASIDEVYRRQEIDAKFGRATSLGGTNRLRGYVANRFNDSYVDFYGVEWRWYAFKINHLFNYLVERGRFDGIQLAAFYEVGTVARYNSELWKGSRSSYGIGVRTLLSGVIFRFDIANSEEETANTTIFIGYPF